eukprot:TRINITY_DN56139_c0_g1_i1.p1 TRINITY_DN56139_c0_g1~~TRINITY_DN56139_c0_g1_i1.p1  ORF type:complete len:574 (+),score=104.34 TRINITY_DN56139_c0_g1_i1:70-1722(+)
MATASNGDWGEVATTPLPPPAPSQPRKVPSKEDTPPLWLAVMLTMLQMLILPVMLRRCQRVYNRAMKQKHISAMPRGRHACLMFHGYFTGGGTIACHILAWTLYGYGVRGGAVLVILTAPLVMLFHFHCVLAAAMQSSSLEATTRMIAKQAVIRFPGRNGAMMECNGEEYNAGDVLRYALHSTHKLPHETGHSCPVRAGPPLGGLRIIAAAPNGYCRLWYPLQLWSEAKPGGRSVALGPFESEEHIAFLTHEQSQGDAAPPATPLHNDHHTDPEPVRSVDGPNPLPEPPPLPPQEQPLAASHRARRPPAIDVPGKPRDVLPSAAGRPTQTPPEPAEPLRGVSSALIASRTCPALFFRSGAAPLGLRDSAGDWYRPPSEHPAGAAQSDASDSTAPASARPSSPRTEGTHTTDDARNDLNLSCTVPALRSIALSMGTPLTAEAPVSPIVALPPAGGFDRCSEVPSLTLPPGRPLRFGRRSCQPPAADEEQPPTRHSSLHSMNLPPSGLGSFGGSAGGGAPPRTVSFAGIKSAADAHRGGRVRQAACASAPSR